MLGTQRHTGRDTHRYSETETYIADTDTGTDSHDNLPEGTESDSYNTRKTEDTGDSKQRTPISAHSWLNDTNGMLLFSSLMRE